MVDFFVSYTGADREWAEWIAAHLEGAGHTTVLQAWDFRPGSNFVLEMDRASGEAARTIAVLSPDYLTSLYARPEWPAAFAADPTGERGTLLPVRVRACDLRGLLRAVIYVDLVGLDEDAARERLLAGVRRERARPSRPPPFPGTPPRPGGRRAFPGALPTIWGVPHRRNPNFAGRGPEITALRRALQSGRPVAVAGLGGVGKTQLAVEHAFRHARDYGAVFWVRAGDATTLAADFAGLAEPLGLPEREEAEQAEVVAAVRRWLDANPGWLLVFDDAPAPAVVRGYLPTTGTGHVVVTSRSPGWRRDARVLRMDVLPLPEAREFLLMRTGQTDADAADALAATLGRLPLALEQAGAYVERTGRPLAGYLGLFRARQAELLGRPGPTADYPATVATTWDLSFQQAGRAAPAAPGLLHVCAFLAPDAIPRDLLEGGAAALPEPLAGAVADPIAFDDAVGALRDYSLLEALDDRFFVHALVQAVDRDRLGEAGRRTWAGGAARLLEEAFPYESGDVRSWAVCARLLPHGLAAAGHARTTGVAPEAAANVLARAGLYLLGRAQYTDARDLLREALELDEAARGPDHPEVAIDNSNLGLALQALGDVAGARRAFERALTITERVHGQDHPLVAVALHNLGTLLEGAADYAGARAYYERALAIDEAAYGPDHPEVGADLFSLGQALREQGEHALARERLERALRIAEATHGEEHPEVATVANEVGLLLRRLGEHDAARAAFARALEIDEAAYGPEHPTVARDAANLGMALLDAGDATGAHARFAQGLRVAEAVCGAESAAAAVHASNVGSALHALGDLPGARAAFERAVRLAAAAYGGSHPRLATALSNLGSVLQAEGDARGARARFEQALAIDEATYGPRHPEVASDLANLASALAALGDTAAARAAAARALEIDLVAFGPDHPAVARDRRRLKGLG